MSEKNNKGKSFKEMGVQDRLDALLTGLGVDYAALEGAPAHVYQNIGKRLLEQSAAHVKNTGRMAFLQANTKVEKLPDGKLRYKTSILATPSDDLGGDIPSLHQVVDFFIENIKKEVEDGKKPNLKLLQ